MPLLLKRLCVFVILLPINFAWAGYQLTVNNQTGATLSVTVTPGPHNLPPIANGAERQLDIETMSGGAFALRLCSSESCLAIVRRSGENNPWCSTQSALYGCQFNYIDNSHATVRVFPKSN